jgi:hypothetical protein
VQLAERPGPPCECEEERCSLVALAATREPLSISKPSNNGALLACRLDALPLRVEIEPVEEIGELREHQPAEGFAFGRCSGCRPVSRSASSLAASPLYCSSAARIAAAASVILRGGLAKKRSSVLRRSPRAGSASSLVTAFFFTDVNLSQ